MQVTVLLLQTTALCVTMVVSWMNIQMVGPLLKHHVKRLYPWGNNDNEDSAPTRSTPVYDFQPFAPQQGQITGAERIMEPIVTPMIAPAVFEDAPRWSTLTETYQTFLSSSSSSEKN